MRNLLTFLPLFFLLSCNSSNTDEADANNSETSNDTASTELLNDSSEENANQTNTISSQNWICYRGTIDETNDIYLEYFQNPRNSNGELKLQGSYHYLNNNATFELNGHILEDGTVELFRRKNGEVRESFYFVLEGEDEVYGSWEKEGQKSKKLYLKKVNHLTNNSSSFLYGVHEIINSDDVDLNLTMDYSPLENLTIQGGEITESDNFYGYWSGNRIYYDDTYENSAGGHDDILMYIYLPIEPLPGENAGRTILQLELQNTWENDYGDPNIDDDDQYGLNEAYYCYISVINLEGGAITTLQKINWTGEGYAQIYYFDHRILLVAGERKEALYWSTSEYRFVER